MSLATITRRTFLFGSIATAGALAFGFYKYQQDYDNPLLDAIDESATALTPYVIITPKDITVIVPRAEMGQGVSTTLAAMVAEELEVSLDQIRVEHGPASKAYYNSVIFEDAVPFAQADSSNMANNARDFMHVPAKFLGLQVTGGSSSTPDAYERMRIAGAAARQGLLNAAAKHWQTSVNNLSVDKGVIHNSNGQKLTYKQIAILKLPVSTPSSVDLKPKDEWKLLGKSLPRVDMVEKCTGTATFGLDIHKEGIKHAVIVTNPHLGGKLSAYDADDASKMRGVERIVRLPNGIAVVASNTWYAMQAAKSLVLEWESPSYPEATEEIKTLVNDSFRDDFVDGVPRNDGEIDEALMSGRLVSGKYHVPFLAHSTMEPMNATALFDGSTLEIWAGNQAPTEAQKLGAKLTGLELSQVKVHTPYMGGGFGRRAELDFIEYAVRVAMAMPNTPVQTTWTREQDTTHDFYRPMAIGKFTANLRGEKVLGIDLHVASASVLASQMGRLGVATMGPDPTIAQGAWDQPYEFEHYRVTAYRVPETLPVSSWRSVGNSQNGFFHESMIDELAHFTGVDPIEFRLRYISHGPSQSVLEAVRLSSNWDQPLPEGSARGVAFVMSFGVPTAQVVELQQTDKGIKVDKIFAAVDVGTALDPRNIEAQVMSGIVYGLTAAMMGEITVAEGKVEQTNFHNYPALRLAQTPEIKTIVLENGPKITGIGEPGTPPVAPALANALFALTGKRARQLPLNKSFSFA